MLRRSCHDGASREDGRRVAGGARPRPLPGAPLRRDRGAVVGRAQPRARRRDVQVRRLRSRALPLGHEVRLRIGLAELLCTARRGGRRDRGGPDPRHAPHRSALRRPAAPTSATSSPTARSRRAFVTASTRSRWTSSRPTTNSGSGSSTWKQAPPSTCFSRRSPRWRTTILRAMSRPRPVPSPGSFVVKNASKTRSAISGGTPSPSSSTSTLRKSPERDVRIVTRPFSPAATTALSMRFVQTWFSSGAFASMCGSEWSYSRTISTPRSAHLVREDRQRALEAFVDVHLLALRLVEIGVLPDRLDELRDARRSSPRARGRCAQRRGGMQPSRRPSPARLAQRRVGPLPRSRRDPHRRTRSAVALSATP